MLRDNPNVSKKDFGHLLVLAGSDRMLGAAALVGLAAMRSGSGLVTCAVPDDLNLSLQNKISSDLMTLPYTHIDDIKNKLTSFNALAIGPGLGRSIKTKKIVMIAIINFQYPMVIDADALNIISYNVKILNKVKAPKILTPHVGEMSRLSGLSKEYIELNKKKVALDFASAYGCVVVLKGPRTVVANIDGKSYTNQTGNAGMAKAGMGDVLTGMIAGLLAQGVPPFEAARFGVYWHGVIGDSLLNERIKCSILATDIIGKI